MTAPSKPNKLNATLVTQTSVNLRWSGVIGATSYNYSFNGSSVTPATESLSGQTAKFTGLTAGTAYSIIVSSVNSGGSTASSILYVTTTPSTPTKSTTHGHENNVSVVDETKKDENSLENSFLSVSLMISSTLGNFSFNSFTTST